MNVKEFFTRCFNSFKLHWKTIVIIFIVVAFVIALVSCQGLVNFNGSDGNNMIIGDSNNSISSVLSHGK